MTDNICHYERQQLKAIGYSEYPMPIRATQHYTIYSRHALLDRVENIRKPSENTRLIYASQLDFPLCDQQDFTLIIDTAFFAQQQGIVIQQCQNFSITMDSPVQSLAKFAKFFIHIRDSHLFNFTQLDVSGGRNILFITHSQHFSITNCTIKQAEGYAIIVHNSTHFQITQCMLEQNLAAGIMLLGAVTQGMIKHCQIRQSKGYFNCDAGIHLCATTAEVGVEQIPEQCHEACSIEEKINRPYAIVIEYCVLNEHRAQGLYLEGAVNCLIQHNQFSNNNKEGVCFDWGSCHNYFINNLVSFNGARENLSNEEIRADFIDQYPILADGSSSMKLAGVSLDNGCINTLTQNKITHNYGEGIKLVRSALLNKIKENHILHNGLGENVHARFYAIALKEVGAIHQEFTSTQKRLLDFLPSQLNIIADNIILSDRVVIDYEKHCHPNQEYGNRAFLNSAYQQSPDFILRRIVRILKRYLRT